MWALCAKDLLLLSLLLFIHFSCSICQTICLPMTPFLFFFPHLYYRSTRFEVRTGVNTVPTSCGVSSLREWGVQVALHHFLSFSWNAQTSLPPPACTPCRRVWITLQNKARKPPTQGRALTFSPLAGLQLKPPALGHWRWHPFGSTLVMCVPYTLRIDLPG